MVNKDSKSLLKEYVFCVINEQEASPNDIFGQWFGPKRRDDVPPEAKDEDDTPEEKEALQQIQGHLQVQDYGLEEWGPKLLKLLKQGKYTKILSPPKVKYAYRLMTADSAILEKILGRKLKGDELDSVKASRGFRKNGGIFKPRNVASSWTIDPTVFDQIVSTAHIPPDEWTVILKAPIKGNNFILNPDTMYDIADMESMVHELETVGIGPIKLDNITYIHSGPLKTDTSYSRMRTILKHYPEQDK